MDARPAGLDRRRADHGVHGPDRRQRRDQHLRPHHLPGARDWPASRCHRSIRRPTCWPSLASQIFVVAAIFAVASLIVHERETGTLAWVASKPVSRGSIWLSKWISSTAILAVAAALVPLVVTTGVVVALYGSVPLSVIALVLVGMVAAIAFFAAIGLAAGTVVPGQPAIMAVGLGVLFLVPIVAGLLPIDVMPYLPTSILDWTVGLAGGQDVGVITPIAWAVGTVAIVALAIRRMERIEL